MGQIIPLRSHISVAPDPERAARDALFDRWLPEVLRWCTRMGGPRVDPEDAAHDIMITVLTKHHTLRNPDDLPAWIFGITRRVLAWHRRKAWVRRWVPGATPEGEARGPGPESSASSNELGRRVQVVLETLPDDLRVVLVLCDLEERTDEQVANLLGIPSGTVKSRLRRARARFANAAEARGLSRVSALPQEEA